MQYGNPCAEANETGAFIKGAGANPSVKTLVAGGDADVAFRATTAASQSGPQACDISDDDDYDPDDCSIDDDEKWPEVEYDYEESHARGADSPDYLTYQVPVADNGPDGPKSTGNEDQGFAVHSSQASYRRKSVADDGRDGPKSNSGEDQSLASSDDDDESPPHMAALRLPPPPANASPKTFVKYWVPTFGPEAAGFLVDIVRGPDGAFVAGILDEHPGLEVSFAHFPADWRLCVTASSEDPDALDEAAGELADLVESSLDTLGTSLNMTRGTIQMFVDIIREERYEEARGTRSLQPSGTYPPLYEPPVRVRGRAVLQEAELQETEPDATEHAEIEAANEAREPCGGALCDLLWSDEPYEPWYTNRVGLIELGPMAEPQQGVAAPLAEARPVGLTESELLSLARSRARGRNHRKELAPRGARRLGANPRCLSTAYRRIWR